MGAVTQSPVAVRSWGWGAESLERVDSMRAMQHFCVLSGVKVIYLQYIHAFVQLPIPA